MKDELLVAHANGMARVRATLVPGNDIRLLAQQVDDLSFSLIAPLGAYDDAARHDAVPLRTQKSREDLTWMASPRGKSTRA